MIPKICSWWSVILCESYLCSITLNCNACFENKMFVYCEKCFTRVDATCLRWRTTHFDLYMALRAVSVRFIYYDNAYHALGPSILRSSERPGISLVMPPICKVNSIITRLPQPVDNEMNFQTNFFIWKRLSAGRDYQVNAQY